MSGRIRFIREFEAEERNTGTINIIPENHKNLLVHISGYNTYFVILNKDIQMELIERTQYGI